MIEVASVVKSFGGFTALHNVSMTVKPGSIYGLVGTNGSGKTTMLNLLAGVTKQDAGTISFDGEPVYENPDAKRAIWFIPDDLSFFTSYTINELATMLRGIYPLWDPAILDVLTAHFTLDRKKRLARMSKGMRKQSVFALAFAAQPDYLLLDEPIDGLDPTVRHCIWELIVSSAADRGMTTIVASHNLREMEGYCDSICALDHGRVFIESDLDDLKSDVHKLQISYGHGVITKAETYADLNVLSMHSSGSIDVLIVKNTAAQLDDFIRKTQPLIVDRIPLTLEEIFIYELGGTGDEHTAIL